MRNNRYTFLFCNGDAFSTTANSCRDALAIAMERTTHSAMELIEIQQPDPDDPYNPDAFISLAGAALDFWL